MKEIMLNLLGKYWSHCIRNYTEDKFLHAKISFF